VIRLASANSPAHLWRIRASRVAAHCEYIGREFTSAAGRYAELLRDDPTDLDLWRDVCWSLRHGGSEELIRSWVFHREVVTITAGRVEWAHGPCKSLGLEVDSTGLDRVKGLLEWIGDDLRPW
jgi:hypothetical protein